MRSNIFWKTFLFKTVFIAAKLGDEIKCWYIKELLHNNKDQIIKVKVEHDIWTSWEVSHHPEKSRIWKVLTSIRLDFHTEESNIK